MELSFEAIISAANGIVRTEQNDVGLELHRFSREQEAFFHKTHPLYCNNYFFNGYFSKNCRSCAGISLDFISDAQTFKIQFGKIECNELRRISKRIRELVSKRFTKNTAIILLTAET